MIQHFRVAKHTNNIQQIKNFYIELLDFKEIGSFENHQGYDGVMLGLENHTWHLEFTTSEEEHIAASNPDDLFVLYCETEDYYNDLVKKLMSKGVKVVKSKNPYWDECGMTFLDPDGNRVVLCKRKW